MLNRIEATSPLREEIHVYLLGETLDILFSTADLSLSF